MLPVPCSLGSSQSQLLGSPEAPRNSSSHPSQVCLQMCPVLAPTPVGVALGSPGCHFTCPWPAGQHLARASTAAQCGGLFAPAFGHMCCHPTAGLLVGGFSKSLILSHAAAAPPHPTLFLKREGRSWVQVPGRKLLWAWGWGDPHPPLTPSRPSPTPQAEQPQGREGEPSPSVVWASPLPAHSQSFLQGWPELGCSAEYYRKCDSRRKAGF